MTIKFNQPTTWIIFSLLACISIVFSYKYFSTAIPLVNLEIKIDRTESLKKAVALAKQFNLGPQDYSQVATFESDSDVQTFVELEAGGKEAFAQMIKDRYYSPYTWQVRHFKEFEKNETTFYFKPDGTPYGFRETISENTPGAALQSTQARAIAENAATKEWNINRPLSKPIL